MYCPTLAEFLELSKRGNVIPVYKELNPLTALGIGGRRSRSINAHLDTPLSMLLKLEKNDYVFLLESVEGQEKLARYSFLGLNPSLIFKAKAKFIEISYPAKRKLNRFVTNTSPLDELKKLMRSFEAVANPDLPRFYGGLVGFMGYDTVRFFERIPDKNPDDLKLPDCVFILTDNILIFDHIKQTIKIVNNVILPPKFANISKAKKTGIYQQALEKIAAIEKELLGQAKPKPCAQSGKAPSLNIRSNFTKDEFEGIVKKAKGYIKRGDVIQVVLSQRFKIKLGRSPYEVYRRLRSLNPSPYMYFLKLKDLTLIGSSPEMLVRSEGGLIQTRPIAGTRPRGKTEQEDKKLEAELLGDKKERAEHLMLVDLARNDLGRVSKTGEVSVNEFMNVEKYSHVMHLVSEVRARLDNKRFDVYDVLKAAFPAGTVSGSPKIRAMEIIDELENVRRGPYAGCVGYFSFSHNMDTCITIRTIVLHKGTAYIQAGAGIVADSIPEKEYFESVNKAKALIEAIRR